MGMTFEKENRGSHRALANVLEVLTTIPTTTPGGRRLDPHRAKRAIAKRIRLMREFILDRAGWVLGGAVDGWAIRSSSDLISWCSFLSSTEVRVQRLRQHEAHPLRRRHLRRSSRPRS